MPGGTPGGRCVKKRRKILRLVLGRDAGAGVAHRGHQRPLVHARAEDDALVRRGLHQRVVDQVAQHLLPAPAVDHRLGRRRRRAWSRRRRSSRPRADRGGIRRPAPRGEAPSPSARAPRLAIACSRRSSAIRSSIDRRRRSTDSPIERATRSTRSGVSARDVDQQLGGRGDRRQRVLELVRDVGAQLGGGAPPAVEILGHVGQRARRARRSRPCRAYSCGIGERRRRDSAAPRPPAAPAAAPGRPRTAATSGSASTIS